MQSFCLTAIAESQHLNIWPSESSCVEWLLCMLTERELLGWISFYCQEISFLSVSKQMSHILDWDIWSPWEQAMSSQRLCLILMDINGGLQPWKHWSKVIRKSWISSLKFPPADDSLWAKRTHLFSLYVSWFWWKTGWPIHIGSASVYLTHRHKYTQPQTRRWISLVYKKGQTYISKSNWISGLIE